MMVKGPQARGSKPSGGTRVACIKVLPTKNLISSLKETLHTSTNCPADAEGHNGALLDSHWSDL